MTHCVFWQGRVGRDGYGYSHGTTAHRWVYQNSVGTIPPGFDVDHICWQRLCVNPDHLRLLPALENRRRQRSALKTQCVNGHELTPDNTYIKPRKRGEGTRDCRTCIRARVAAYTARKKEKAA